MECIFVWIVFGIRKDNTLVCVYFKTPKVCYITRKVHVTLVLDNKSYYSTIIQHWWLIGLKEGIVGDRSKILRAWRCFCVCVIKMRCLLLRTENLVKLFVCFIIIYINASLIKIHPSATWTLLLQPIFK